MLIKLDPIWVYFCISNHNLILNSYGDIHHSSWTKRTGFVTQMRTGRTKLRTTLGMVEVEWYPGRGIVAVLASCHCPELVPARAQDSSYNGSQLPIKLGNDSKLLLVMETQTN